MFKKIKNLALTSVLVCSMMPMVVSFAYTEGSDKYRQRIALGGNSSSITYDWTKPDVKITDSDSILLVCEGMYLIHGDRSVKTCKALPQSCSYYDGTYSADSSSPTYNFTEGFDKRLQNGIKAGRYARVRFAMEKTSYTTKYDVVRHYY